jgi:hypothetical protein
MKPVVPKEARSNDAGLAGREQAANRLQLDSREVREATEHIPTLSIPTPEGVDMFFGVCGEKRTPKMKKTGVRGNGPRLNDEVVTSAWACARAWAWPR